MWGGCLAVWASRCRDVAESSCQLSAMTRWSVKLTKQGKVWKHFPVLLQILLFLFHCWLSWQERSILVQGWTWNNYLHISGCKRVLQLHQDNIFNSFNYNYIPLLYKADIIDRLYYPIVNRMEIYKPVSILSKFWRIMNS